MQKSLGGQTEIAISSSYLKIIKCCLAVKWRLDSHVNVAEKTANNFRGLLFSHIW